MTGLPRILVTGASGFVGHHLIDAWRESARIFALARRPLHRTAVSAHPNLSWHQADIGDRYGLDAAFREVAEAGGADTVVHLAAHYDFTGEDHPEYERTNVRGMRNVLEACRALGVRHFVFPSSLAACRFPRPEGPIREATPADAEFAYARTKEDGESMVREFRDAFRTYAVRFAAMFSDACEYPPLYVFLETWLSGAWNRHVLGGRGESAITYLHVRDAAAFIRRLIERSDVVPSGRLLIASPDRPVSHRELFARVVGPDVRPILVPRSLCRPGMWVRDRIGRLSGQRPFERPWMAAHIDRRLEVDPSVSTALLDWSPRRRLLLLDRIPFLLDRRRIDVRRWHEENRAAFKEPKRRESLFLASSLARKSASAPAGERADGALLGAVIAALEDGGTEVPAEAVGRLVSAGLTGAAVERAVAALSERLAGDPEVARVVARPQILLGAVGRAVADAVEARLEVSRAKPVV